MKKKNSNLTNVFAKAGALKKKHYLYLAGAVAVIAIIIAVICMSGAPSDEPNLPSEEPTVSAASKSGYAEVDAVPVVTLEGDCLNDYQNWNDKSTYYPATLTFDNGEESFTMDIEIKPQGTSSMAYPKKNFTVKFSEGVKLVDKWGEQKKYVLKADYIDPTVSGNVVSAKLAAEMNAKYGVLEDTPNYGVIDGFPIFVKINGEDAGLFSLTIPKDAWLFNMDEDNPNHLVLACEGWSDACTMTGYNIDFEADWTFEVGEPTEESKAAFQRVVEFVATADDKTFVEQFDQYLDLDACLNYMCFINAAYGHDNVTKNLLMATYDGKVWYPVLYDLDSLWGINWNGEGLAEPNNPWTDVLWSDRNNLFYRVGKLFGDQFRERYQELREGILSKEHIMEAFADYTARIPQEYYDINNALWYTDGNHIRTHELMGQLMDEYLPIMDQNMAASAVPSGEMITGNQNVLLDNPMVHYVWETDGVQHSLEDINALPVSATFSYTLNGKAISAQELAGKSGKVVATLRVERKANTEDMYGVAAVVQLEEAQCKNLTVTGGTHSKSTEQGTDLCMGSVWLGATNSVYEMKLTMNVTDFDPAKYVVTIQPVYITGGDGSLDALLSTAAELSTIINDGISLHTSMQEWHTYLTNIQTALEGAGASAANLLPADQNGQESAEEVARSLLTNAEAEADTLLKACGYQVTTRTTTEDRVKLLSQLAGDTARTEAEKEQAGLLQGQIGNYRLIVDHLEKTGQTAQELNEALQSVTGTMPDLVGAYSYANDALYGILYRISTLYQNIANYYAAVGGHGSDLVRSGDWSDVIIFTNHQNIVP